MKLYYIFILILVFSSCKTISIYDFEYMGNITKVYEADYIGFAINNEYLNEINDYSNTIERLDAKRSELLNKAWLLLESNQISETQYLNTGLSITTEIIRKKIVIRNIILNNGYTLFKFNNIKGDTTFFTIYKPKNKITFDNQNYQLSVTSNFGEINLNKISNKLFYYPGYVGSGHYYYLKLDNSVLEFRYYGYFN